MRSTRVLAAMLLVSTLPGPVFAQISPGPLSRPHESLEGSGNCTQCHGRAKENMDQNCLACHGEIRARREAGAGFHARNRNTPCATCHPDHAGKEFELIHWGKEGREAFDHAQTGWPLEGKHAATACRDCHKGAFQSGAVLPRIRKQPVTESWLGLETRCATCHQDPHRGGFGEDCASCHAAISWKQVQSGDSFPHERTRFPLQGRHRTVPCASCHDPAQGGAKKPAFALCADCHRDPHAGKATLEGKAADCAACHNETSFARSTYSLERHTRAGYPLEGKHRETACRSCHRPAPTEATRTQLGSAGVEFHPEHGACRSCHGDAHAGQLAGRADGGACESCHRVEGWTPSGFTVAQHAKTPFPLDGAHREAACRSCHGPKRTGLPPLPGATVTGSAGVMLALGDLTCGDCHIDPHAGRFAKEPAGFAACIACHSTTSFHRASVDVTVHARFSYPLEGAHRAVPCVLCHGELDHAPARSTLVASGEPVPALPFSQHRSACEDCHQDPHGGQFGPGHPCASCHDGNAFRPATRFDHDRDARFRLAGAHERVPCQRCHPEGKNADGSARTLYKPLAVACQSCHGG